ncbi:DUF1501 domain-containing protein [Aureliella helgolandensis]|uniref:Sulfatase n=1 Tax=Aureliella helgolandensis TaxID=2527968 RepID=A0A518GF89_9BACT|nr:DUF1501 domain-containing protein [Aureliella helgolandensis]QDV27265.1 hypothetical protein Q31a_56530 [Aureliella helgolandensis]
MNALEELQRIELRRSFLGRAAAGVGALALNSLLNPALLLGEPVDAKRGQGQAKRMEQWTGVVNPLHFPQRVKRVIHLSMAGGPSHLETFDYKPKLAALDGQPMPKSFTEGQQIAQLQGQRDSLKCMGPQFKFSRHGEAGTEISSILPHMSKIVDDICVIKSMHTDQINHDPAHTLMNTGTSIPGRPSMGSWLQYGLGSEADDLPGYVVMTSVGGGQSQPIASRQWHSGFLPSRFQGVEFRSKGDPVLYVGNPKGVNLTRQREVINAVQRMNQLGDETFQDPEIATRIAQYELAFKMQTSVPELMDISGEPQHILDLYGTEGGDGSFASNCLLARRLAERGVRFIQLYHRGWDHHGGIKAGAAVTAKLVDQGTSALIQDLRQRGMLDDTLVIWGGEFGRTPMAQGSGRDHHIKGFSTWLAGGGVTPGTVYGATDELGYSAIENPVHVNDLHATMLYLFGIDHERLTYRFQGRDFRLTDVAGKVVHSILS